MKNFRKKLMLIFIFVFSAWSLSGCVPVKLMEFYFIQETEPVFEPEMKEMEIDFSEFEGSAGHLSGRVVVVTVLVSDQSSQWTSNTREKVRQKMKIACSYIEDNAENYGQNLEIFYDNGRREGLVYETYYDGEIKDYYDLVSGQADEYLDTILEVVFSQVDEEEIMKSYNADSIAFVGVVNKSGCSYAYPYSSEYAVRYYNECACVFYSDETFAEEEPPAVYAHEILHLFGARDLYESSNTQQNDFVSDQYRYIESNYSNEIMYTTYDENGYAVHERITNELSSITAYYLGWDNEIPNGFIEVGISP